MTHTNANGNSDSPPPEYYEPDVFRFRCTECEKETDHGSDLEDICIDCAQPTKRIPDALERVMRLFKSHADSMKTDVEEMGSSKSVYNQFENALGDLCDEVEYWVEKSTG